MAHPAGGRYMDERTESFEPHHEASDESYEWDYEEVQDHGGRVLWGRVVFFIALIGAAFYLGRTTAPEAGIPAGLDEIRAERDAARAEVEELQAQIGVLTAQEADPDPTPAPAQAQAQDDTQDDAQAAGQGRQRIYVVKAGDTLRAIAERFYDDATLDDFIADANGIENPAEISIGQRLVIPPKP